MATSTETPNQHPVANSNTARSGWLRVKWSDPMVRLLIQLLSNIGSCDDAVDPSNPNRNDSSNLHIRGKWNIVSKLMLDKGFFASPQQCEDKFNHLNKRYKRLNEILGHRTTCRVVEKPSLLDSMVNLSDEAKAVARKIMNSKQLFYREMCAYHNPKTPPNSQDVQLQGIRAPNEDVSMEDDSEDDDEDDDEDDEETGKGVVERFIVELDGVLNDQSKTKEEIKQWLEKRAMELQEERIGIDANALALRRRVFEWEMFREKNEREFEWLRLEDEKLMIENQKMLMLVKKKELDLEIKMAGNPLELPGQQMELAS